MKFRDYIKEGTELIFAVVTFSPVMKLPSDIDRKIGQAFAHKDGIRLNAMGREGKNKIELELEVRFGGFAVRGEKELKDTIKSTIEYNSIGRVNKVDIRYG